MSKFKIIQDNPYLFKNEILDFWKNYLPGTPAARLDWMENNPVGPAIWLFAIEEKTGKLVGTISLFPKELFLDGEKIKSAILGDFMVHHKFRVFGPAFALLKEAIAYQKQGAFDFIYTIPNSKSKKIIGKFGFRSAGELYSMMCPQQCHFVIEKYVGSLVAKILDKPLLLALTLYSRATYAGCPGIFEEIDWHNDEAFNEFCQQICKSHIGLMTGDYSLIYLDWRYRQNPEFDFQVFTFRKRAGENIQGLFIISLAKHRLELYDIQALDKKNIPAIIKKIIVICKKAKSRGIYCSIYENNPFLPVLKKCSFFDTKDRIEIYIYPEKIKGIEQWSFTSGDRNI